MCGVILSKPEEGGTKAASGQEQCSPNEYSKENRVHSNVWKMRQKVAVEGGSAATVQTSECDLAAQDASRVMPDWFSHNKMNETCSHLFCDDRLICICLGRGKEGGLKQRVG